MPEGSSSLAVKVGIFVVAALVLMIGFSLRLHEQQLGRDVYPAEAYFDSVLGLEEGSDVYLAGVRVGEVAALAFSPERRAVRASLRISQDYPLPADTTASIERSPLLGTSDIVLTYGTESQRLAFGGEIATIRRPDFTDLVTTVSEASEDAREVMDSVKGAADDAREMLAKFNENQGSLVAKLEAVIDENRENLRTTSQSFATVGPKLEQLADRLNEVATAMSSGQGTLGKLYADETLYEDLKAFTTEMRQISADIKDGDGSLSRLIYDDTLVATAEDALAKVGDAGQEVQSLLGDRKEEIDRALASLNDVGPRLEAAINNLNEVARKINEGEGTLGRLVNDPSLFTETQKTVSQIGESFESSEEQGVIRSFFGVIFGAVI